MCKRLAFALASSLLAAGSASAQTPQRFDGLIPIRIDDKQGKLFIEVLDSTRVLMFTLLATGLGSNPIGLDRGGGGGSYVTRFERNGDRMLVVFENWNYRSSLPAITRTNRRSPSPFPKAPLQRCLLWRWKEVALSSMQRISSCAIGRTSRAP